MKIFHVAACEAQVMYTVPLFNANAARSLSVRALKVTFPLTLPPRGAG